MKIQYMRPSGVMSICDLFVLAIRALAEYDICEAGASWSPSAVVDLNSSSFLRLASSYLAPICRDAKGRCLPLFLFQTFFDLLKPSIGIVPQAMRVWAGWPNLLFREAAICSQSISLSSNKRRLATVCSYRGPISRMRLRK
jgi:hypothetical protein